MKKLFSVLFVMAFAIGFSTTGKHLAVKKNCHAQACLEVAYWESVYGDDLDIDSIETIYQNAYNNCIG